jgi:hypothetical protein
MAIALDRPTVVQVERRLRHDDLAMSLPDAVTRGLGGIESWTLTLGDDGRLRAITILAPALRPLRADPTPAGPAPAEPPRRAELPPLDRPLALPPGGALARIVGGTTATGRQLADLALRRDDAEIRAEAVRVGVDAMLADPTLEAAFLGALDGVDDAGLARAVTGIAGDATDGLLSLVAERARGRPLGRRAARVLERVRER